MRRHPSARVCAAYAALLPLSLQMACPVENPDGDAGENNNNQNNNNNNNNNNDDGDAGTADPSDYIFDPEPPPPPKLDENTRSQAIQALIDTGIGVDTPSIVSFYNDLMQLAETDGPAPCPFVSLSDDDVTAGEFADLFWQGNCTTSAGVSFSGFGFVRQFNTYTSPEDGQTYDGLSLSSTSTIISPDGRALNIGATINDLAIEGTGYKTYYRSINGNIQGQGEGTSDLPWLNNSLRGSIEAAGTTAPLGAGVGGGDVLGRLAVLRGGLSGPALPEDVTAGDFADLQYLSGEFGVPCTQEPFGTISIRDDAGNWYDIVFDGPTFENPNVDLALCDGCGSTWYYGEEIGSTCADFSALLNWEEKPW